MEYNLPMNDLIAQYLRKITLQKKSVYIQNQYDKLLNCEHLFLKLQEEKYIGSFHSSDCYYEPAIVECVYCGLTNKFMALEKYTPKDITLESIVFLKIFQRNEKDFTHSIFNLISKDILKTQQASLLYQLAILINPNAQKEELFQIMTKLNSLETDIEREKLSHICECNHILKRYPKQK